MAPADGRAAVSTVGQRRPFTEGENASIIAKGVLPITAMGTMVNSTGHPVGDDSAAAPRDAPSRGRAPSQQRVGGFTCVPTLIRELGADPAPIFERCGLPPDAFDVASNWVPYVALGRVLSEAAARTACPHFGLLAARAWRLSDLGVPGDLMRHAPTVGVALAEFVLHHHLNSEGALAFLIRRAGVADFGYAIYDPEARGTLQLYGAAIGIGANVLREICGAGFSPSEVYLAHSPPVDTAPYRQYFRSPVRFNAEFSALRFPESVLERPIEASDPARFRRARAAADALGGSDILQSVRRALRTLLLHGTASGADVAQVLQMHRRTLNRRLSSAGSTFQRVLDEVRYSVAKELLENSTVPMHDVAAALGYAGLTPFMRAFRRWSGTSPGDWRKTKHPA